jgi:hypothetical protein
MLAKLSGQPKSGMSNTANEWKNYELWYVIDRVMMNLLPSTGHHRGLRPACYNSSLPQRGA